MEISTIRSEGYCFQIEMTRRAIARGGSIAEVPITFIEREHGKSKMSFAIALEAVLRITAWGALRLIGR
jgi:dolichol-phosphate mannosyltransferase